MLSQIEQQISEFAKVAADIDSDDREKDYYFGREQEANALWLEKRGSISKHDLNLITQREKDADREWQIANNRQQASIRSACEWIAYFQKIAIPSIEMELKIARLIDRTNALRWTPLSRHQKYHS